jgi:hypothetical protein
MTAERVVVGDAAGAMRRQLGPTAWAALETMVSRSVVRDDALVVETSVRSLGAELGLAKDTVARALVTLRAAGVLTGVQARAASGTFAVGEYFVRVAADVLAIAPADDEQLVPGRVHSPSVRARRAVHVAAEQLALLAE